MEPDESIDSFTKRFRDAVKELHAFDFNENEQLPEYVQSNMYILRLTPSICTKVLETITHREATVGKKPRMTLVEVETEAKSASKTIARPEGDENAYASQ